MPIVEPILNCSRHGKPLPTAHAWSEGSNHAACGKRVGSDWIVDAVAWTADPTNEYRRCRDCIVALKRRRRRPLRPARRR